MVQRWQQLLHTHTRARLHVLTSILPGGSELTLYTPSLHVLVSINHQTKQMSGTKEGSPGLWGEGGEGGGGGRKDGTLGEIMKRWITAMHGQ